MAWSLFFESFKGKTCNLLPIQVPSTSAVRLSIQGRWLDYHLLKKKKKTEENSEEKKNYCHLSMAFRGLSTTKKPFHLNQITLQWRPDHTVLKAPCETPGLETEDSAAVYEATFLNMGHPDIWEKSLSNKI